MPTKTVHHCNGQSLLEMSNPTCEVVRPTPCLVSCSSPREDAAHCAGKPRKADNPYRVVLSVRFLLTLLASSIVVSFVAGRVVRKLLLRQITSQGFEDGGARPWVPGKLVVFSESVDEKTTKTCLDEKTTKNCSEKIVRLSQNERDELIVDENNFDVDDESIPGQQLLIDFENIDGIFLTSKSRLKQAISDYLHERRATSQVLYHACHQLTHQRGGGLMCSTLLENGNRIHLTTWPIVGAMAADILLNDVEDDIIDDLAILERIFGVQSPTNVVGLDLGQPHLRWSARTRGFFERLANPESADVQVYMRSVLEQAWKKKVVSVETKFQTIDIYDTIHPHHGGIKYFNKMMNDSKSCEGHHCEIFRPDRLVFLDGVMQSRFYGDSAYHEALVHPAMLSHPNPRRVAIIGGGEGATLREVLKHKTVDTATMIEIDEEMVYVSRQHLPEWSDCSNLIGSAKSCFDDPRSELFYVDAISWFLDRFLNNDSGVGATERYDVIIMDALYVKQVKIVENACQYYSYNFACFEQ